MALLQRPKLDVTQARSGQQRRKNAVLSLSVMGPAVKRLWQGTVVFLSACKNAVWTLQERFVDVVFAP